MPELVQTYNPVVGDVFVASSTDSKGLNRQAGLELIEPAFFVDLDTEVGDWLVTMVDMWG